MNLLPKICLYPQSKAALHFLKYSIAKPHRYQLRFMTSLVISRQCTNFTWDIQLVHKEVPLLITLDKTFLMKSCLQRELNLNITFLSQNAKFLLLVSWLLFINGVYWCALLFWFSISWFLRLMRQNIFTIGFTTKGHCYKKYWCVFFPTYSLSAICGFLLLLFFMREQ